MYFAVPASTADLERSFSSTGFILDGRWRLLPRNLEMQVVIRDWLLELQLSGENAMFAELEQLFASLFPQE